MTKQSELYGIGYKKGIQDCWKEVLKFIKKANDFGVIKFEDISIMTLQHYLTMIFGVKLDSKEVLGNDKNN